MVIVDPTHIRRVDHLIWELKNKQYTIIYYSEKNSVFDVTSNVMAKTKKKTCAVCFAVETGGPRAFGAESTSEDEIYLGCELGLCDAALCSDCLSSYLEYAHKNTLAPVCVAQGCNEWYPFNLIALTGNEGAIDTYLDLIYTLVKKDESSALDALHIQSKLLSKLLEDRLEFLETNIPKALSVVVKAAYQEDVDRISNRYRNEITKVANQNESRKSCLNLICRGYLDDQNKCVLCGTVLCSKCEQEKVKYHRCKKEDLESMKDLKKLVECPDCHVRIERSMGCDHMTCVSCGAKFNYKTGEKSEFGSQNKKVKLVKQHTLYTEYSDLLSLKGKAMLLLFEKRVPIYPNKKDIWRIMDNMTPKIASKGALSEIPTKSMKIKLCLAVEKYKQKQKQYREHILYSSKLDIAFRKRDVEAAMTLLQQYRNNRRP